MGTWKLLGIALAVVGLAMPAFAQTVCPSGGGCTQSTTRLPDPGEQSPTTMNNNSVATEAAINGHDSRLDALTANDTDTSGPLDLEPGTTVGGQELFDFSVVTSAITDPGTDCEREGDMVLEDDGSPRICWCIDNATDNWACAALTD